MRQCVFLSMDSLEGFPDDDQLLIPALRQVGWHATEISWHKDDIDWNRFDIAVIRSTWDYQDHQKSFQSFLEKIDKASIHLENDLKTVLWNMDKKYLKDLENKGIKIVPTIWKTSLTPQDILTFFTRLDCEKMVIKPTVGAGAMDTFLITADDRMIFKKIETISRQRSFMAQPFMEQVLDEGEFSLVFFDNEFSHAVLKQPKSGDFRVQEEYGGKNSKAIPDPLLLNSARQVLDALDTVPLYARTDFVRAGNDFYLMELELVEPSLYLDYDTHAPARFAAALDRRMR